MGDSALSLFHLLCEELAFLDVLDDLSTSLSARFVIFGCFLISSNESFQSVACRPFPIPDASRIPDTPPEFPDLNIPV